MKIIFFGTPEFAVTSLDILVKNRYEITAVVTTPDKPAGRNLLPHQSDVKKYALEKNLKILQPGNLKDENFLNELKSFKADLQIIVAFRMLPETVWAMPPLGTFNLHASLLPQYRGAAPINRAIMNGEKETGVTTFFLQKEIDTGKIIFREKVSVGENETAGELHDKMMNKGAELVLKTVKAIENGTYPSEPQSQLIKANEEIKKASKIFKEDCRINWKKSVTEIYNHIRGLSPYPAAFTEFLSENGTVQQIKIYSSSKEIIVHSYDTGKILSDEKTFLKIASGDGFVNLLEIQQAGKRKMRIDEFLRGFRINQYQFAK